MNKKKLMALGLVMTLSMTLVGCKDEEQAEISKVSIEALSPRAGELTVETAYIGSVAPEQQVYVIPMTSGTVTETFFKVGDTVKEGDVLFKIDDEAAQLQMKNANATYASAKAGVTAQTDGARDLQNYQTEEQIRQLKETWSETEDTIDDLEDDLDDVRNNIKYVSAQLVTAKQGLDTAQKAHYDKQNESENVILANEIAQLEQEIAADKVQNIDTSTKEANLATKKQELTNALAPTQLALNNAQSAVNTLQATLTSLEAGKAQLKSGIESAKDGKETLEDNINMAQTAYNITTSEIYPQTDAVSAAQLSQASIAIDSAKMQLDFCTVEAPISGVIEAFNVEKEGMAAAGNVACIISNKNSMTVTFSVAEKAKNVLAIGDKITVEHNNQTYSGTITEIGTMADQMSKLFKVKASVSGASDSLPNGVSAKVYATTQKQKSDLIIPYDAVYFAAGDAYVYCIEDGKAVKTSVQVGLMNDTDVVVEEGLTEDSLIVSNWSSKLRNGAEVEILYMDGEAVSAEEAE